MTYNEAYSKIIDAYFKDEIRPFEEAFCICGTLAGGSKEWNYDDSYLFLDGIAPYTYNQFKNIERPLLDVVTQLTIGKRWSTEHWDRFEGVPTKEIIRHSNYEDALFVGMCAALEVLKQIHIDRGEVIDPLPTFTKRVFSDVLKMVK